MSRDDRGPDSESRHLGTLFVATLVGVGVGLLAAPQPGHKTRRALGKRLAGLREDVADELEDLSPRARRALADLVKRRQRKAREAAEELEQLAELEDEERDEDEDEEEEDEEEDEESQRGGGFARVLSVAAGLAATAYLLTSERAAPARERVLSAAATVRDEAEERWEQLQRWRAARTASNGGARAQAESGPPAL